MQYDAKMPDGASNEVARVAQVIRDALPYSYRFVRVDFHSGWVTLNGRVEWNYQCEGAETVVRSYPGVAGVTNLIGVDSDIKLADVKRRVASELAHQKQTATGSLLSRWVRPMRFGARRAHRVPIRIRGSNLTFYYRGRLEPCKSNALARQQGLRALPGTRAQARGARSNHRGRGQRRS